MNKNYSVKVYHTHIEVTPYTKGDVPQIEKAYSKWDSVTHKYIEIGFYISDNILYLPRGTSMNLLAKLFNTTPILVSKSDNSDKIKYPIQMKFEPRDRIQKESIDFLTSENQFKKGLNYSQYGLNLDTGDGKTYCMISGIIKLMMKSIIITHKSRIKNQWYDEFISKSDISSDRIMCIDGSDDILAIMSAKKEADVYIVNHQTISSFARLYSWEHVRLFFKKAKIGIKVIDEAHKFFENTLMLDFFSNVKRSYYLTATFTRSDPKEVGIFKKAFSTVYRFGEETLNYEEKRKHINLIAVLYHSKPDYNQVRNIIGGAYGFNSYKYIDYALKYDNDNTMIKIIKDIINKTSNIEGKILITSPKIESVEMIANALVDETDKTIGVVHSKQNTEMNDDAISKDIISSTIKGIGEGDNIKGLRILINTEPIGSHALVDQLRGRLREYSSDDDTYLFYLIDTSIGYTYEMFKRIKPVFQKKCKEIIMMKME